MAYSGFKYNIPYGDSGLITDLPPGSIPPNALLRADNITLENGTVEKARGGRRYNATPLSAGIVAVVDYWPDIVKQRLIAVCSDGTVYRDIGDKVFSGGTAIASGLGPLTPNTFLVTGGQETAGRSKKLFLFTDGQNQLKVLAGDGIAFADITAPAADWVTPAFPKVGIIHRNRLWAFQGQRAYASNTGDHENFTSSFLTQNVFPGEGGEIVGTYVFKGRMFAFKDGGFVYYLDDSDTDSTNWNWRKLASNFGLAGPHGVLDALDDMLAVNTTGTITSYRAADTLGDIESADVFRNSMMERFIHAEFSKSGLSEIHALYYPEKKQVYFTYRSYSRPTNNTLICLDMGRQAPRVTYAIKGTPQCLALRKDVLSIQRPIYGDASGYVILMDQEDRTESTAAYTATFDTPAIDFRQVDPQISGDEKHFDSLSVEFVPEGDWNLTCDYFIDGKYIDQITFKMAVDVDKLGNFTLDEDRTATYHTKTITKRLAGTGRNIQFRFTQGGSNQSFQVASITVAFRPAGQRQLRRS